MSDRVRSLLYAASTALVLAFILFADSFGGGR